jgi:hypothetical protein
MTTFPLINVGIGNRESQMENRPKTQIGPIDGCNDEHDKGQLRTR